MSPPPAESRKAFHELLDLLREVDERYAGPEWGIEGADETGGALRAALHLLEASLVTRMESVPTHPYFREFPLPTRKFLGDNADAIYFETAISPEQRYLLRGNMADAVYVSITIESGAPEGAFPRKSGGVINDSSFDVAPDGSFEVRIGGEPSERNYLALPEDASRLTTRHYYEDERPAALTPRHTDFRIEALDHQPAPGPPTDASVAASIRRVANFIRGGTLDQGAPSEREPTPFVSRVPNEFPKPTKPGAFGLAAADAAYSMAPYLIGPDDALLIRAAGPTTAAAQTSACGIVTCRPTTT